MKDLKSLFVHFLRDIYYAENKITKALPKMARKASNADLKAAFEHHLEETHQQIENLEKVFDLLDLKPRGETCEAIKGIIEEGEDIMDDADKGDVRDAGMIAAAQAVEHYEITRYGTLVSWAKTLDMSEAAKLLQANLDQEYAADEKLDKLGEGTLNRQAA